MLTSLLHRLMADPRIYDFVQRAVGADDIHRRIARHVHRLPAPKRAVDIGGGTGAISRLLPPDARYICLDIDPAKLVGFHRRSPNGQAILGDASRIPLAEKCADLVFCTCVSHHLDDNILDKTLAQIARILSPTGSFVFLDPVWSPKNPAGRLIWRYDRGSFPRTPAILRQAIQRHMSLKIWEPFTIFHAYVLAIATPAK